MEPMAQTLHLSLHKQPLLQQAVAVVVLMVTQDYPAVVAVVQAVLAE
jgi:hypothetical protein